ncbi:hypothetical protein HNR65_002443 [Desulfosalsimonas propionicica]|uniref:Uncharacterized protein n=1 Tax=Desulfosalsimonas propionicica TaxID=332175 RepID=A0A7W0CAI4_9BACT|nr:hypothetical protein [Desulfosalsimonas propionicica]MBA2882102.1 hypothetical protein [Desulfosalsimonas propionicica]
MKAYLSSGGLCPGRQLEQTGGSRLPSLFILFVQLVLFWVGITSFLPFIHGFKNDGGVKVQYLRYAQFLRISRTDNYAAFYEIAQALILNFYGTIYGTI